MSGKDRSLFADNRAFVGNPADYGVRGLSSRGGGRKSGLWFAILSSADESPSDTERSSSLDELGIGGRFACGSEWMVVIELGEGAASRTQARGFFVELSCMPSQTSNFRKEASVGARRGGGWEALGAIKRASSGPDRHGHTGQEDPDRGGSRW